MLIIAGTIAETIIEITIIEIITTIIITITISVVIIKTEPLVAIKTEPSAIKINSRILQSHSSRHQRKKKLSQ